MDTEEFFYLLNNYHLLQSLGITCPAWYSVPSSFVHGHWSAIIHFFSWRTIPCGQKQPSTHEVSWHVEPTEVQVFWHGLPHSRWTRL